MGEVKAKEYTLDTLLGSDKNLVIPDYQRTYCWRKKQILDLLNSIKTWQKERGNKKPLHLGTIVLKENIDDKTLEIIDGQQRLITLSILQYCLDNLYENSIISSGIETGSPTDSYDAKKHIIWANTTIKQWIDREDIDSTFSDFLKTIIFCVVTIPNKESLQLAYTFFNAMNSAGKKLSDSDLLKAHHLRYIKDENIALNAVLKWNSYGEKAYDQVLNRYLYRLRSWNNNTLINLTPINKEIFNHFSSRTKTSKYFFYQDYQTDYHSTLRGGAVFFDYVEHYKRMLDDFFKTDTFILLKRCLSKHNANGVVTSSLKPLLFLYFIRFGNIYLSDALFCISFTISILRNKRKVIGTYINEDIFKNCVKVINSSVAPDIFFNWALSADNHYKPTKNEDEYGGKVRNQHWQFLVELYSEIEKDKMFVNRDLLNEKKTLFEVETNG